MKPKKLRALARQLHSAAVIAADGDTVAVSLACDTAHRNHGIDSRDVLRALGATHLGRATVDRGEGTGTVNGSLWSLGDGRYLRVNARFVLDVSDARTPEERSVEEKARAPLGSSSGVADLAVGMTSP